MAVLDNQAIPLGLLQEGDALAMAEMDALQVLLDFSLIKGDAELGFFSMHPLQQLSTQNWLRLDGSRLKDWEEHCLVLLSERMPKTVKDEEKRRACSILFPHARIAVSYESRRLDCRSLLLLKISTYEELLGRYQDCYQHAVQAYEESIEAHGKTSKKTLACKMRVAMAVAYLGKRDEASRLLKECQTTVNRFPIRGSEEAKKAKSAYRSASTMFNLLDEDSERSTAAAAFTLLQEALEWYRACSDKRM
ncbi:MAG: hypothetical protein Q9184_008333, partial [Pyrenodesmia sp. 2 TL-2023]